jgi:hypothetical protein
MKTWHRSLVALGALAALVGCGTRPALQGTQADSAGARVQNAQTSRVQARIHFQNLRQLDTLERHGIDLFENVDSGKGTVDALLTAEGQRYLKSQGLKYEVSLKAMTEGLGFPSGYQTVEAVDKDMQALALKFPQIARLQTIGKSLEGRPLYALEITSKPGANLPAVRLQSGQHARELPPVELSSRLMHLLTESYGSDAKITNLVDTRDIWIVPIVNPDGRTRVEQGQSMWRKNARKLPGGAWGVDTNRNGDDHFEGGDDNPWSDAYRGPAPFSEPESQAIRDLAAKVKFAVSLDLHCYAGMILWPPGYDDSFTKDEATFKALGTQLAKKAGYKAGTIARTIYRTYGDLATWEYDAHGTLAFAAELGDPGFNPSYSQVDKDWAIWKDNYLLLIDAAGKSRD